jgi:hypothetical protein
MDEVIVFLLILIVAVAILGFLLKVLVGTIVIWGGVLMVIGGSFAWGLRSKWSLLNSHEKASELVTLSFDGNKVRWQTMEPAFQAFLETRKFATIGIGFGFVWIIVCTGFGLSHASKGWGIFSALVLTPTVMPFMIQGYSSLMRLKIVDCISQASGGKNDASRTQGGMSEKRAMEILNVPEGYSRTDVEDAYVEALSAFHPDRYSGLSPTLISHMNELSKDLGEAKSILLGKFKG